MNNGDGLTLLVAAALMSAIGLVLVTRAWELAGARTRPFYMAAVFSVACDAPVWYAAHEIGWSIYPRLIGTVPQDPIMWILAITSFYAALHPLLLLVLYIRHRLVSRRQTLAFQS